MSDEDALLAAITANPDEDTPRLAYADWLDEHDQALRAEFIRTQIEIAHKQSTLPRVLLNRHVDLFKRNDELISHHRIEVLGPVAGMEAGVEVQFDRGFVSQMSIQTSAFLAIWQGISQLRPLPRIVVTGFPFAIREFLGFDLREPRPGQWAELVSAMGTKGTAIDDVVLSPDVLSDPQTWPRLDELDISGLGLGDVPTANLLRADRFPQLADLDLSGNDLTDAGVVGLLASGLPRQLKRLILGGNAIGDQGAIELADRWPKGAGDRLEHLNFRFTNIGQPGHQALLARFGGRVDLF